MSAPLHTVFAADAHLTEREIVREEPTVNRGQFLKFREGTQMLTVMLRMIILIDS
jgi:hypothetical protein